MSHSKDAARAPFAAPTPLTGDAVPESLQEHARDLVIEGLNIAYLTERKPDTLAARLEDHADWLEEAARMTRAAAGVLRADQAKEAARLETLYREALRKHERAA